MDIGPLDVTGFEELERRYKAIEHPVPSIGYIPVYEFHWNWRCVAFIFILIDIGALVLFLWLILSRIAPF